MLKYRVFDQNNKEVLAGAVGYTHPWIRAFPEIEPGHPEVSTLKAGDTTKAKYQECGVPREQWPIYTIACVEVSQ